MSFEARLACCVNRRLVASSNNRRTTVNETTGKNVLTKRAAMLAAARIVAFAMTIPLPLVLVRTLSQSEFGLYKQIFQILMTVLALAGLQVNMSVLYFLPRNPDKK